MTTTIALPETIWDDLLRSLDDSRERAAVLLAGIAEQEESLVLTVNEVVWVPENTYELREEHRLRIASAGWMHALKRAATRGLVPVFFHTHPNGPPEPSIHDDEVDAAIASVFRTRSGAAVYASVILGVAGGDGPALSGRLYAGREPKVLDRVRIAGRQLRVRAAYGSADWAGDTAAVENIFDRQIRAFGVDGQRVLRELRVGVVGCGGTGSAVAEQLTRLGIGALVLIDHDIVTNTNVTRVYGSTLRDAGRPKTAVVANHLESIGLGTQIDAHEGDVTHRATMEFLRGCDVIFGCTDNHSSRAILSRLAYWYLIPVIDMGVVIAPRDGAEISVYGRVTVATPGEPCLLCRGEVDPQRAAEERLASDDLKRLADEGYARGLDDPDPSVVAYTTLTAAYAVADFLQRLFGFGASRLSGKLLLLISDRSIGRPAGESREGCYCVPSSKWGLGDRRAPLGLTWAE